MRVFLQKTGLVGLLALGSLACAPLQASLHMREAKEAMQQASEQQAATRSPYAWTMAGLYLEKAKEKNGYSHYEQAMEYAKKAKQWALTALNQAMSASEESP